MKSAKTNTPAITLTSLVFTTDSPLYKAVILAVTAVRL